MEIVLFLFLTFFLPRLIIKEKISGHSYRFELSPAIFNVVGTKLTDTVFVISFLTGNCASTVISESGFELSVQGEK